MSHSILYVYEGFKNPGDSFSYSGTRHYLHKTLDIVCEQSVALRSTRDLPNLLELSGPELVVFAGAPWFWEGSTRSVKYAGAYALMQMTRAVPKIAVGVGSCFLAEHTLPLIEKIVAQESKELRQFWGSFDGIIVRDILAWWILDQVGVPAILAPCPSIAVGDWFGKTHATDGLVVLSEPLEKNFMYSYLSREDELFYRTTVHHLMQKGASCMEWVSNDRSKMGSRSLKSMCKELIGSEAENFFTARVHAALVAMGMGFRGDLLALDSRALSARLYGAELVGSRAEAFYGLSECLEATAPSPEGIEESIHHCLETIL
jgi:hypothetical protein